MRGFANHLVAFSNKFYDNKYNNIGAQLLDYYYDMT